MDVAQNSVLDWRSHLSTDLYFPHFVLAQSRFCAQPVLSTFYRTWADAISRWVWCHDETVSWHHWWDTPKSWKRRHKQSKLLVVHGMVSISWSWSTRLWAGRERHSAMHTMLFMEEIFQSPRRHINQKKRIQDTWDDCLFFSDTSHISRTYHSALWYFPDTEWMRRCVYLHLPL